MKKLYIALLLILSTIFVFADELTNNADYLKWLLELNEMPIVCGGIARVHLPICISNIENGKAIIYIEDTNVIDEFANTNNIKDKISK